MQILKAAFTILVLLGCQEVLFAQSYFDDFLKEEGLSFNKPEGYELVVPETEDDDFKYRCFSRSGRPNNITGEFHLHNKDKSVVILIQNYGYKDITGVLTPYWYDGNKIFYHDGLAKCDTSKYPIRFYNSKELSAFNADGAVELTRNCDVPGNPTGYFGNRSIYISKAYQGNFALAYLFKDSVRANQDKIFEQTKHMLTYAINKPKLVSNKIIFERHYVDVSKKLMVDSMASRWMRGGIYNNLYYFNREQSAFKFKDVLISVQLPVNTDWPYLNKEQYKPGPPELWEKANANYKQYLTLAKNESIKLDGKKLSALGADDGYIFDFQHNPGDLYRNRYERCIVLLFHKKNIGSVLLKYYYQGDKIKAVKAIEETLGLVKFKDAAFFSSNTTVFPY